MKLMLLVDCDHEDFFDEENQMKVEPAFADLLQSVVNRLRDGESVKSIAATPIKGTRIKPISRLVIGQPG